MHYGRRHMSRCQSSWFLVPAGWSPRMFVKNFVFQGSWSCETWKYKFQLFKYINCNDWYMTYWDLPQWYITCYLKVFNEWLERLLKGHGNSVLKAGNPVVLTGSWLRMQKQGFSQWHCLRVSPVNSKPKPKITSKHTLPGEKEAQNKHTFFNGCLLQK